MAVNINTFRSVLRGNESTRQKLLRLQQKCHEQDNKPFISVIYQDVLYHILEKHFDKANVYLSVDCILRVRE